MLDRALALRGRGPYVVQAAIASLHADEPRDWPQIAALYGELARLTGSPVVELNRAVAVAEAQGPEAGLAIVERLDLERLPLPALDARRAAAPARPRRRGPRRLPAARWRWSTTTPSGGCSSGGWPSSDRGLTRRDQHCSEHGLDGHADHDPITRRGSPTPRTSIARSGTSGQANVPKSASRTRSRPITAHDLSG